LVLLLGACAGPGPEPFPVDNPGEIGGEEGEFGHEDVVGSEGNRTDDPEGGEAALSDPDVMGLEEKECDSSLPPIVAAHGYLAAGDTYGQHALRFEANGHCPDAFYVFDWNSLDTSIDHASDLDMRVDQALEEWESSQVILMGHSAGGGLGYVYLEDPERAAKVLSYVHIGSYTEEGPAGAEGEVPTLNLYSANDMAIEDQGDIPGATNIKLDSEDHYEVATSEASFEAIYTFIHEGVAPETLSPALDDEITVSGRVVTFGENNPVEGVLSVFPIAADTGARVAQAPIYSTDIPLDGAFESVALDGSLWHEFLIDDETEGSRPIHYYQPPMAYSHPLLYLRTLPPAGSGSIVGLLTSILPFNDEHALMVVFSSNRAMTAGEDSLTINGTEVLNQETAPAENTTIAIFFYDDNNNGESEESAIALFGGFPFISGVDFAFPAGAEHSIEVNLNGRTVVIPAWPSESAGASVVVFD
jgi:pimeloyl-ACP methyl ester carboxylesterase